MCLGNISKYFAVNYMMLIDKMRIWNYKNIDAGDILDIHKYLMVK